MFNVAKFEFTNEQYKINLSFSSGEKNKITTYLDKEDSEAKDIECIVDRNSSEEQLLKLGEQLSNEVTDNFNVQLNQEDTQLTSIIESLLIGLTPINIYSKDYKPSTKYYVNGSYQFESIYLDALKRAESYNITRVLNHLPYNDCNPESMVGYVSKLFTLSSVNITVLRKEQCESMNLQGMLTLSKGSRFEPAVIKIDYITNPKLEKIALVGKGVTFDTGGYSLKSGRDISGMKTDMGGANAVLGAIHLLSNIGAAANVTGYLMLTDNMINEQAMIPGDVITYDNQISVEVANTDAEGRLILADGLLLAQKDGASKIIDIATLTGNSVAALGSEYAALFSNDQNLANVITACNEKSNEKVWQMPLVENYRSSLKGNISDYRNISSMSNAGSITAGLFLENFITDRSWAHIDMAGQSAKSEHGTKYSGYGVRLLSNIIKSLT